MRGKGYYQDKSPFDSGITPAHAGKRYRISSKCLMRGDHPRTCGEKILPLKASFTTEGSPPHMRGKGSTGSRRQ